jgi:DNA-binding protein HU-beta
MIKQDIINATTSAAEMPKAKAEQAVEVILDELKSSMARGERIEIRGFGVFVVKPRNTRDGSKPQDRSADPDPAWTNRPLQAQQGPRDRVGQRPMSERDCSWWLARTNAGHVKSNGMAKGAPMVRVWPGLSS